MKSPEILQVSLSGCTVAGGGMSVFVKNYKILVRYKVALQRTEC
jgi:hypothetical protein